MRTVVVYVSTHHGNTKKLLDAIAEKEAIDMIDIVENKDSEISDYDLIGIASGIAFGKYYPQILEYLKAAMPEGKKVFFIHTAGSPREDHNAAAKQIALERNCECLGTYFCKGFDTYGPFKLIGGINKNHPDQKELDGAVQFYQEILNRCLDTVQK